MLETIERHASALLPSKPSPVQNTAAASATAIDDNPGASSTSVEGSSSATPDVIVQAAEQLALYGGETAVRMSATAHDAGLSVDEKQRRIYAMDNRAVGWTSENWHKMLGCTASAARQTDWWKIDRKKHRGGD